MEKSAGDGSSWRKIVASKPDEAQLQANIDEPNDADTVTQVQDFDVDENDECRTIDRTKCWIEAGENFGFNDMEDMNVQVFRITERLDCICEQFNGDPEILSDMVDCIENDISTISSHMEDLINGRFERTQARFQNIFEETYELSQVDKNLKCWSFADRIENCTTERTHCFNVGDD